MNINNVEFAVSERCKQKPTGIPFRSKPWLVISWLLVGWHAPIAVKFGQPSWQTHSAKPSKSWSIGCYTGSDMDCSQLSIKSPCYRAAILAAPRSKKLGQKTFIWPLRYNTAKQKALGATRITLTQNLISQPQKLKLIHTESGRHHSIPENDP